ncbi:MAG: 50S ribosomal protein L2, partial [Bacteroidia bacterium]|nr:50S ribosomal protein L2 [Bacteroidia bacterium]
MAVRKIKPVTPGQRHKIASTFENITSAVPEKSLLQPLKKTGGRNVNGKRTMRYIGGGHKKMYRIIDFRRDKDGMPATVKTIEYDPNRSSRIALVLYNDGEKKYIVAPVGLQIGQTILSGKDATPEIGNTMFLNDI